LEKVHSKTSINSVRTQHPLTASVLVYTFTLDHGMRNIYLVTHILGVRMKGIQTKETVSRKLIVSGLCHRKGKLWKFSFHARLTRMRRYISATTLGITWTEIWVGDGSAEVDQSLGLLRRRFNPWDTWMSVCVYYVCAVPGSGLATG
jgi:hypothetical protein